MYWRVLFLASGNFVGLASNVTYDTETDTIEEANARNQYHINARANHTGLTFAVGFIHYFVVAEKEYQMYWRELIEERR